MEIVRARVLGFCMGVSRAVELALKTAEEASQGPTTAYTLGPLIHNPAALDRLLESGIGILDEKALPTSLEGATVIVRAHGIGPETRRRLESLGARIVDATCPRVLVSQARAREAAGEGRKLVLVGDPKHAEILAIAGYAPNCVVVSNVEEARALSAEELGESPVVIGQTTIKDEEYEAVCAIIRERSAGAEIVDSICQATRERQEALVELAREVDAIVVVGGRASANTTRLARSARESGKPSWQVERASELPAELFDFARVGIAAGASTPEWIIEEVERRLGG
jgi:4-hydroxy-3-methylbut-2-en-1-yl diphosphate reductase